MTEKKSSTLDVYEELRESILNFEIYPGSRVTESELAERFEVSRTPVRAALQRLEVEGYITIRPKQGCFVRSVDIDELNHYYQVRITLELMSIELACNHMSDQDLKELANIWDPKKQEGRSDNADEMEALDESFHLALSEGSGNIALTHYLKDINRHIRAIRRLDFTSAERIEQTYIEHYRLCQLLLKRDVTGAQDLLKKHIKKSEDFAKNLSLTQLARSKFRSKL